MKLKKFSRPGDTLLIHSLSLSKEYFMATTKKRLNITLPDDLEKALAYLAKRDAEPQSVKAVQLIRLAVELDEDGILGNLAAARDQKRAKFISHEDAWQ